eukprot:82450-Chlamydomonas_euryale.AAC.2
MLCCALPPAPPPPLPPPAPPPSPPPPPTPPPLLCECLDTHKKAPDAMTCSCGAAGVDFTLGCHLWGSIHWADAEGAKCVRSPGKSHSPRIFILPRLVFQNVSIAPTLPRAMLFDNLAVRKTVRKTLRALGKPGAGDLPAKCRGTPGKISKAVLGGFNTLPTVPGFRSTPMEFGGLGICVDLRGSPGIGPISAGNRPCVSAPLPHHLCHCTAPHHLCHCPLPHHLSLPHSTPSMSLPSSTPVCILSSALGPCQAPALIFHTSHRSCSASSSPQLRPAAHAMQSCWQPRLRTPTVCRAGARSSTSAWWVCSRGVCAGGPPFSRAACYCSSQMPCAARFTQLPSFWLSNDLCTSSPALPASHMGALHHNQSCKHVLWPPHRPLCARPIHTLPTLTLDASFRRRSLSGGLAL